MKNLILFFLSFITFAGHTQTFEGTIRWTMNLEITDPQIKAQMAEAQKQLNDPEAQAQLKELEEKMKDPEMKKMMEQNPQIKAAMENAMKSAKTGGAPPTMDNMMPKGMIIKIKASNMLTLMEGGMTDGMEVLQKGGQAPVRINRHDKTYSKLPDGNPAEEAKVKVISTGETIKLLGYTCEKYVVEMDQGSQQATQIVWATTEIKDIDIKTLSGQRTGQGQPLFSDKIAGFPMRIEVAAQQGNMVMEVAEIKREKLSDNIFVVPSGFKEVKM